jgi:hypothetical protein
VSKRAEQPERSIRIKVLDPLVKCGQHTSVQQLFRVDEQRGADQEVHLVFFDQHGWYCVHGRSCRAVDDVRRHQRAHYGAA